MIEQAWADQCSFFHSKTTVYVFRLDFRFALTLAQEQQEEA